MRPVTHVLTSVYRHIVGLARLRDEDVWLASFPRSGSTWVRTILLNTMLCVEGEPAASGSTPHFLELLPNYGFSDLSQPWPFSCVPRIIKTHRRFNRALSRPRATIYIIRDPRDSAVSYFDFLAKHKGHRYRGDFSSFLRHSGYGLEASILHYLSWQSRITYLLRYEKLCTDPFHEFVRLFAALGWEIPEKALVQGVESSTLEKMRQVEEARGPISRFDSDFRVVRSGGTGHWQKEFDSADLRYFRQLCETHSYDCYS